MDNLELKKIEEFLSKEENKIRTPKYQRLVIVSDSKGSYLRTEANKIIIPGCENFETIWWTSPGRNTQTGVKYLVENINKLKDGKKTIVLIWHLTCDITKKIDKLIYPRYNNGSELIENILPALETIKRIHREENDIDFGILEAPPVFTKEWNRIKDSPHWEVIDDYDLHQQVSELNKAVQDLNQELNYNSPRFECDFLHRRRNRKKGSSGVTKTKETLNPFLLKDGVHPVGIVARKWWLKIINSLSDKTVIVRICCYY